MQIGILQCGHSPDEVQALHGDYDTMFAALLGGEGLTFRTWNVVDMEFPADVGEADGWLITGSKHGAYEDLPFIPPLEDFLRAAHAAKRPMVGICFGHQVIAQALGGKVVKFEGGWAVGQQTYTYEGVGEISLNAWHQDQVVSLPEDARVVATSGFCENAALVYGDHILTLQPHPEIPDRVLESYIDVRGKDPIYPPEIMARAVSMIGTPSDEGRVARLLGDFLKAAHARASA